MLRENVWQALRSSGAADASEVDAVVLESDGDFSVLKRHGRPGSSTLVNVRDEAHRR